MGKQSSNHRYMSENSIARKEDPRAVCSKNRIMQAFQDLLEEKGFAKTTVTDIIGKAGVNRSTFYAHYVDKFDLLNKFEDELLAKMAQISRAIPDDISREGFIQGDKFKTYITRMLEVISESKEIFTVIYDSEQGALFQKKLFVHIDEVWQAHHIVEGLKIDTHYAQIALVGMSCSLIGKWIEDGCKEDVEEFSSIMSDIISSFIEGVMR